jgi:hypothetical protein
MHNFVRLNFFSAQQSLKKLISTPSFISRIIENFTHQPQPLIATRLHLQYDPLSPTFTAAPPSNTTSPLPSTQQRR